MCKGCLCRSFYRQRNYVWSKTSCDKYGNVRPSRTHERTKVLCPFAGIWRKKNSCTNASSGTIVLSYCYCQRRRKHVHYDERWIKCDVQSTTTSSWGSMTEWWFFFVRPRSETLMIVALSVKRHGILSYKSDTRMNIGRFIFPQYRSVHRVLVTLPTRCRRQRLKDALDRRPFSPFRRVQPCVTNMCKVNVQAMKSHRTGSSIPCSSRTRILRGD